MWRAASGRANRSRSGTGGTACSRRRIGIAGQSRRPQGALARRRRSRCRRAPASSPSAIAASRSSLMPIDSVSSCEALLADRLEQAAQRAMRHPLRLEAVGGLRDRHQPAQAEPRQLRDRGGERRRVGRRHAALSRLAADVDLNAHLQRRQVRRPLLGEALGDLQPIDRMDPVEMLGGEARLVALQRADQVPLERARRTPATRRSCRRLPAPGFRRSSAARPLPPRAPLRVEIACSRRAT